MFSNYELFQRKCHVAVVLWEGDCLNRVRKWFPLLGEDIWTSCSKGVNNMSKKPPRNVASGLAIGNTDVDELTGCVKQ